MKRGLSLLLFFLLSQKEERIPLEQVEEVLKLYCGSYLKFPISLCSFGVVKYDASKGIFIACVQDVCKGGVISGEFETLEEALEFLKANSVVERYFWEDLRDYGMVVVHK